MRQEISLAMFPVSCQKYLYTHRNICCGQIRAHCGLNFLEVLRAMLAERADEVRRQGVTFVNIAADIADIAMLFFFALRNIYSLDSRIYVNLKNTVN